MPSIPQSLLWISLVVLWLFVLVPMLISKRDAVRRTSDVALATRVLNTGASARLLRRGRPAAGHRSDPDWQPSDDDLDDDLDEEVPRRVPERSVVRAAVVETEIDSEPDYLDVDVVDPDSGALPIGESHAEAQPQRSRNSTSCHWISAKQRRGSRGSRDGGARGRGRTDGTEDQYEYVADSSGLEAPSDTDLQLADSLSAARRRRYESRSATVDARKYKFRKRMLTVLAVLTVASAVAAFTVMPRSCGGHAADWCRDRALPGVSAPPDPHRGAAAAAKGPADRAAATGRENTDDREFDVVPSRLRRPGSVVLEIDDEDPVFEHLDYAPFAREFDMPRAAGQ